MNTFNKTLPWVILALGTTFMSVFQLHTDDWKEIMCTGPTISMGNGKYYLTGIRNQEPQGFVTPESTGLERWTVSDGTSLQLILWKEDQTCGEKGLWASRYSKDKRIYYFTYTANEQTVIASSKSMFGPFRQKEVKPIDVSVRNIDPFLLKDGGGKYHLYHVRFNKGDCLRIAEFDIKKGDIKPETLKQYTDCTESWKKTPNHKLASVMEEPTVMEWDGVYHLSYPTNHFMNIDYSVGYATASSSFGPWKKHPSSPITHRSPAGEGGSGYGDVFKGLDGRYYYVYHAHRPDSTVSPHETRIVLFILEKGNNGIHNITVDKEHVVKSMWKWFVQRCSREIYFAHLYGF